jgi:hypothetical protein
LEYFLNIWDFYDHFLHFVFIGYIISGFGILYQDKSGNPGWASLLGYFITYSCGPLVERRNKGLGPKHFFSTGIMAHAVVLSRIKKAFRLLAGAVTVTAFESKS